MKKRVWAIIGGGNGGQTLAGHLAILGEQVRLYSKSIELVNKINQDKIIHLTHSIEGEGKIEFATTDIEDAIKGADNIVIVLPSNWHESTERKMIPFLVDGQNILILPEASCGALSFRKLLMEMHCSADITIGAGCSLPYATRVVSPGVCCVYGIKKEVKIAALPSTDNKRLEDAFCDVFTYFRICENVIETSIDNINAMMHPAPVLLNIARIEAHPIQNYEYYREGITPSICELLEKMDTERIAVAKSFGIKQRTLKDNYIDMYQCGDKSMSLYDLIRNNDGYEGLMNAKSIRTRYILEDIPYSLVAISALGQIANIDTPCIDAIITIGRAILGKDLDEGRNLETLGLQSINKEEFLKMITGEDKN